MWKFIVNSSQQLMNDPWLLTGDYNVIRYTSETSRFLSCASSDMIAFNPVFPKLGLQIILLKELYTPGQINNPLILFQRNLT